MTPERAALWDAVNKYVATCGGNPGGYPRVSRQLAVVEVERAVDSLCLRAAAEMSAALEAGVRGDIGTVYPNWVYEARDAIRHQNAGLPWLPDLLAVLGWQGGTVHEALNAVARLVQAEKDRAGPLDSGGRER